MSHVAEVLDSPHDDGHLLNVSWAAYHAGKETRKFVKAINAMLPLFHQKSTDPSMVAHVMNLVKNVTTYLNPTQPSVVCGDQPIFAMLKIIQWNWPEVYGEHLFVIMFGSFHIEQAFLKVLGHILEGSGWTSALANAKLVNQGTAEGLQKVGTSLREPDCL